MSDKQIKARQKLEAMMKRSGIAPAHIDALARVLLIATNSDGHLIASDETRQMLIDALGESNHEQE